MRLTVDTTATNFITAGPAEPSVDFESKQQRLDENGHPIFTVHLFAVGSGTRDVISVKVSGEPKGIGQFTQVKLTDLVATTWQMGDRFGVSFKASKVDPIATPKVA